MFVLLVCYTLEWCRGVVASWRRGVVASWRRGVVASWRRGVVASWRRSVMVSWLSSCTHNTRGCQFDYSMHHDKSAIDEEGNGNHLMNSTSLENTRSPVSGF